MQIVPNEGGSHFWRRGIKRKRKRRVSAFLHIVQINHKRPRALAVDGTVLLQQLGIKIVGVETEFLTHFVLLPLNLFRMSVVCAQRFADAALHFRDERVAPSKIAGFAGSVGTDNAFGGFGCVVSG